MKRVRAESPDREECSLDQKQTHLLSPHTMRLLKLVRDGTVDQASAAGCLLSEIAATTCSPMQLWEILGRLTENLSDPMWKTRTNGAMVLECIASYLPITDQVRFLEHPDRRVLFVTIEDVGRSLDDLLSQGRPLYAASACDYDEMEEHALNAYDQKSTTLDEGIDFVKQRIRLQRSILAKRLGFGNLGETLGADAFVPATITSEDLILGYPSSKRIEVDDKSSKSSEKTSLKSILVNEMQRAQKRNRGSASHENPQSVLATELLYRMFDPEWYVRHGAILGISSLLRAWMKGMGAKDMFFGAWLHDILARCICVLTLDRFGDFSGSLVGELSATIDADRRGTGGVVAPVREVAGQLLSLLYTMAPPNVQRSTLNVLIRLTSTDVEWEIRHGGFIGLKFIAAIAHGQNPSPPSIKLQVASDLVASMVCGAIGHLVDESDDVRSVAAQLLIDCLLGQLDGGLPLVTRSSHKIWSAINSTEVASACIVDMISLLSVLLEEGGSAFLDRIDQEQSNGHGIESVATFLMNLLKSDYVSVRISALRSIRSLANEFPHFLGLVDSRAKLNNLTNTFEFLMQSCFNMFLDEGVFNQLAFETRQSKAVWTALHDAWSVITQAVSHSDRGTLHISDELLMKLMGEYFDVELVGSETTDLFLRQVEGSDALLLLAERLFCNSEISPLWEFCTRTFMNSPWKHQAEGACLLYSRLRRNNQANFSGVIPDTPLCLRVSFEAINDSNVVDHISSIWKESFYRFSAQVIAGTTSARSGAKSIVDVLIAALSSTNLLEPYSLSAAVNRKTMRIAASIAGASLEDGLPATVTPIARALMTSFKNEVTCQTRMRKTCDYLVRFLELLKVNRSNVKAEQKILTAICDAATGDENSLCTHSAASVLRDYVKARSDKVFERNSTLLDKLKPLLSEDTHISTSRVMIDAIRILSLLCSTDCSQRVRLLFFDTYVEKVVRVACEALDDELRTESVKALGKIIRFDAELALTRILPILIPYLSRSHQCERQRIAACELLHCAVDLGGTHVAAFVRNLLKPVMALMTDQECRIAELANHVFASLVRVAPLAARSNAKCPPQKYELIDHLILGKPLPPCKLPLSVDMALRNKGVILRDYQREGIAWMRFLQSFNLSGALCDDMGVGKTIQALVSVAIAHEDDCQTCSEAKPRSLIICPTTLVRHWEGEVKKFFPESCKFRPLCFVGNAQTRKLLWTNDDCRSSLIITNYAVLRSEIEKLRTVRWCYCVLDEGHLLKNPKTATARASKRLQARHKLILSGTPIQNHVQELWAAFDFLMPNFLGTAAHFKSHFADDIAKSQQPSASAQQISNGIEKLKLLHQQVLPFILRREKGQVLRELPPKNISTLYVGLTDTQAQMYTEFCNRAAVKTTLTRFDEKVKSEEHSIEQLRSLGSEVLKSILYLRLLCTHPCLVMTLDGAPHGEEFEASGKLQALAHLLQEAGIYEDRMHAADNDSSLVYCDDDIEGDTTENIPDCQQLAPLQRPISVVASTESKCLIFAQFTKSLDVVESLVLKPLMPSVRYVRLDGRVPDQRRFDVAEEFNSDPSVRIMLLTTRVGGLGLNLTGADMVVFIESDFNPFADIQAMDRAHRLGQLKTVNVYRLVTSGTIEEKIMEVQNKKIETCDAVVNTENSSIYSMGTDRLLDIFSVRETSASRDATTPFDLDALLEDYAEDYQSLSVDDFLRSLNLKNGRQL